MLHDLWTPTGTLRFGRQKPRLDLAPAGLAYADDSAWCIQLITDPARCRPEPPLAATRISDQNYRRV